MMDGYRFGDLIGVLVLVFFLLHSFHLAYLLGKGHTSQRAKKLPSDCYELKVKELGQRATRMFSHFCCWIGGLSENCKNCNRARASICAMFKVSLYIIIVFPCGF